MEIRWNTLKRDSLPRVRTFLEARESFCVPACERFIAWDEGPDRIWCGHDDQGTIQSLLILSATGILYPVLSEAEKEGNRQGIAHGILSKRIRSIQGQTDAVKLCEDILTSIGQTRFEQIDYALMKLDSSPFATSLIAGPESLIVRRAEQRDADELFPLQAAYEIEEVLPSHASFKPAASRLALERILSNRIVLSAELDGKLVGKANTNARSFSRDQIGGVYVLPEYRGRGIATRLVGELCAILNDDDRGINLFVKRRNLPAQAAYRRVGFDEYGDYRISYLG